MKRWSYGAVLLLHGLSTLASFALYCLRDADTLMTLGRAPALSSVSRCSMAISLPSGPMRAANVCRATGWREK